MTQLTKKAMVYRTAVIDVQVSEEWLHHPEAGGEAQSWSDLKERIESALAQVVTAGSTEFTHVKVQFLEWNEVEEQAL